jgi:hypothetical protein
MRGKVAGSGIVTGVASSSGRRCELATVIAVTAKTVVAERVVSGRRRGSDEAPRRKARAVECSRRNVFFILE